MVKSLLILLLFAVVAIPRVADRASEGLSEAIEQVQEVVQELTESVTDTEDGDGRDTSSEAPDSWQGTRPCETPEKEEQYEPT